MEAGRILFGDARKQLLSELAQLARRRHYLEAQQVALRKELEEVDAEAMAKLRMLGLVDATEQQLAGPAQGMLREDGPDLPVEARFEVRGGTPSAPAVAL
jgi:hypothetical protein